jgi:hypothetical protein
MFGDFWCTTLVYNYDDKFGEFWSIIFVIFLREIGFIILVTNLVHYYDEYFCED